MSDLEYYELGETSYFASKADQRFGYCLYVPSEFSLDSAADYSLAVIVHGSGRTPQKYRSLFKDFAEENRCIILAPLFPSGVMVDGVESNYKFLRCGSLRFDHLLLAMVDEVRAQYGLIAEPFLMHGFSGGGHFAHRFFYLHPELLRAVSIGAPGMVTLLDASLDWHCGVGGMEEEFNVTLDYAAMRKVPVQMVVGGEDIETWEITIPVDDPLWMFGVNDAGTTRIDRLQSLRNSFEKASIDVQFDVVPGVAHEGFKILTPVKQFFSETLNK